MIWHILHVLSWMPVNTLHVIAKRTNYLKSVLWYAAANVSHNMKLFLMFKKSFSRSHCLICKCLELWKQSSPICTSPLSPDYLLCTPAYLSRRKAYWRWPVTLWIQVNNFNLVGTPLLLCPYQDFCVVCSWWLSEQITYKCNWGSA